MALQSDTQIGTAMRIIHDMTELGRGPFSQPPLSPSASLPDYTLAAVQAESKKAAALLARVNGLDLDALPPEIALTLRLIRFDLRRKEREGDWYWHVFDPSAVGFYGMFAPTSYCMGFIINGACQSMRAFAFERASDKDRYLGHVSDIARQIDQFAERTEGQAERGIIMPKPQLDQALPLLGGLHGMLKASLPVADQRLGKLASPAFAQEIERRLKAEYEPAFARFTRLFDDAYRAKAPEKVGLSQYPGGAAVYAELVKVHTTMDMTPEEVHATGLERMKRVRAGMAEIREQSGFAGNDKDYLAALDNDPAWRADSVDGIIAVFQRYIDRMKPHMAELFDFECRYPYGAAPLPKALEASMTFGFYSMPTPDKERGEYLFNAANLSKNSLFNIGPLNYHEMVPGHHFHLSTQKSNESVHPLHNFAFYSAFNEGWAEYSATLAGEAGMYGEPAERFGRLVMDAFLTCRLVVDTGMNALGWSLEQARDYMRENSFMPETEIRSESLRYSCDIPGQSLAYKLGDTVMLRLREKMKEKLGNRYDIKDFHRAVLHPGGMPLPDLEWHIDRTIEKIAAEAD